MAEAITPAIGVLAILRAVTGMDATPWKFSIGKMPATPDNAIALMDYGGPSGEVAVAIDYPRVQVIVRGGIGEDAYPTAYAKVKSIREALVGIPARPMQMPELSGCVQVGDIQPLGYDSSNRPMFSQNFQLTIWHDTSGYRDL